MGGFEARNLSRVQVLHSWFHTKEFLGAFGAKIDPLKDLHRSLSSIQTQQPSVKI
jgi:hypothetical protein